MNAVEQILGAKPDQTVYNTEPSASAQEAVRLMAEKNIGALVVGRTRKSSSNLSTTSLGSGPDPWQQGFC